MIYLTVETVECEICYANIKIIVFFLRQVIIRFVFLHGGLTDKFLYCAVFKPQDLPKLCYNVYADLFTRTPSRLLWEAFSYAAIARRLFVYKYTPLFVFKYSFIQLGEL